MYEDLTSEPTLQANAAAIVVHDGHGWLVASVGDVDRSAATLPLDEEGRLRVTRIFR